MTEALDQASKSAGVLRVRFAPALRFLMAGAVNTLLSIAVYQAMLFVTGHVAAYVIAYAVGILFAYVAYARHVFDVPLSKQRFVVFVLFYIASGCVSTAVNAGLIDYLALHARLAIFVTVMVMLPLNYFGAKWCLREGGQLP
ncbi:MAG: GtrA family protein [Burkholderiales bacterium]